MVTRQPDNVRKLQTRVEKLAHELAPRLRERGSIVADPDEIRDVGEWREAARRAGKLVGCHVRTGTTANGSAWVVSLDDEPAPEQLAEVVIAEVVKSLRNPTSWRPLRSVPTETQ